MTVGVNTVESGGLRVERNSLFEDLGVAARVQFIHDVVCSDAVRRGRKRFADAIAIAVVRDVNGATGGVAGDQVVLKIVFIRERLTEAGAKKRVAVGIVGIRIQAVIGIERGRSRAQRPKSRAQSRSRETVADGVTIVTG